MESSDTAAGLTKIANLLALLLIRDMSKSVAAVTLSSAGFSTKEVAGLLGTSEGSVRALASQVRRRAAKSEKSPGA